ncbi:hypothetical protein [Flammeovirga kamogawensis]|uniref:STAS/SEC14 domain-containing protein n=2 Tax=Flammeovirga kamogawensis TaxID=373891 RepID=A0ABX8GWZ4_9BACT|nr:hypothetical protein [Flammeovirga kamogawensis]MBB6460581.1 hypothetical protein [Flammeovirga kamogawensis]QWG07939.1 hypothetical protein KM029_03115 [Flammeovirga kamogawensis]TRX69748.1 hypothetical protein EO216_17050 [Flammeovirga kamogawensis]
MTNSWLHNDVIELNNDCYKNEVINWIDAFHKYSPSFCISDLRNFNYKLSEELQQWSAEYSRNNIRNSLIQKYAVIVSKDFMTHVAIENILDEYNASYEFQYFLKLEDAMNWIFHNYPPTL